MNQINNDPFDEMFKKALVEIELRYVPGTLNYAERKLPHVVKEIIEIEVKLNEIWKSKQVNLLEEFRGMLKRWYWLHLSLIEKYKKQIPQKVSNKKRIEVYI